MGRLHATTAQTMATAMRDFSQRIAGELSSIANADILRARTATQNIIAKAATDLDRAVSAALAEQRAVTFQEVSEIMKGAQLEAAASVGVRGAVLGAIRTPPIAMMGAFEGLGAAQTWRTLLQANVRRTALEANTIVSRAILEGMGPVELSRRLRLYVTGSESFQEAFAGQDKVDLRRVPAAVRGAAGQMRFNAERIAFSEYQNARHEAEVQAWIADPLVGAVQWTLSPNRGTQTTPDECDVLASTDFYGLGAGVYPVDKVPPPPHPFDRCELLPVVRPVGDMGKNKPSPARAITGHLATIPRRELLSPTAATRIQDSVESLVGWGDAQLSGSKSLRAAIRKETFSPPIGSIDEVSGKLVGQSVNDVDELIRRGHAVQPTFEADIRGIANELGIPQEKGQLSRVKTRESAYRKIGDQGRPANSLNDFLGGRLRVDTEAEGDAILHSLEARGYRILEDDNFIKEVSTRAGYRARHLSLVTPDGRLGIELQVIPREVARVQELAHHFYDVIRNPKSSKAARDQATRLAQRLFDGAWGRYKVRVGWVEGRLALSASDEALVARATKQWNHSVKQYWSVARSDAQKLGIPLDALDAQAGSESRKKLLRHWIDEGKGRLEPGLEWDAAKKRYLRQSPEMEALDNAVNGSWTDPGLLKPDESFPANYIARDFWERWTKNSTYEGALALKVAASEAFGTDLAVSLNKHKIEKYIKSAQEILARYKLTVADVATWLRAERATNVALLRTLGYKTIKLYRGVTYEVMTAGGKALPEVGETSTLAMKGLSSWTTNFEEAKAFGSVVYEVEAPIENVVASYLTRYEFYEQEFVLAGKPLRGKVVSVSKRAKDAELAKQAAKTGSTP
jgi:hypothetical protein